MLKNWIRPEKPEGDELKQRLKAAQEKLESQQMKLKDRKLPVLVLIEGWGAAGKGQRHRPDHQEHRPPLFQGLYHARHPHRGGGPQAFSVPLF